jgi:starch synthase
MRVDILTKEYPPQIYGGAGVHVAELVRALRARDDIDARVRCFGGPRDEEGTTGYADLPQLSSANAAIQTFGVDLSMAGDCVGADLVHSHTWYANFGGHLASLLAGVPHVVSAHSLEPMRPWKAEQLGGGYALSSFCERTALEHADAITDGHCDRESDVVGEQDDLLADRLLHLAQVLGGIAVAPLGIGHLRVEGVPELTHEREIVSGCGANQGMRCASNR